jgi:hypothetical protein
MSIKHAHYQTPVAMSDIDTFDTQLAPELSLGVLTCWNWAPLRLATKIATVIRISLGGIMVYPEEDLNHQVATATSLSSKG